MQSLALQIGRQNINGTREWWWDEDLDPEQEDVLRVLARAGWAWRKRRRLELYFLHQNDHSDLPAEGDVVLRRDRDVRDADLTWLGLRARGRLKTDRRGRFYYWLDSAIVRGEEFPVDYDSISDTESEVDDIDVLDVRGWGVDAGVTCSVEQTPLSLTLAIAHGSGDDDPGDGADRAFRQTGLQDNNGKFRGFNRFRYYGEVLRPELSNLRLITLSAGWRFWSRSSVELLYHRYWQDRAAPFLRDAELDADPSGKHDSLGDEIDLVIGIEEWKHWDLEFIAAALRAGRAYGEARNEIALGLFAKTKFYF